MKKVVTLGVELDERAQARLAEKGASVEVKESPSCLEDFLVKVEGADVIYSDGGFLLESLPSLRDVLVTYPYVELGDFDAEEAASRGVYVANARGGNRNSIVEWVVFMTLALMRNMMGKVRVRESIEFERTKSLEGKRVLIVGAGNIGTEIGKRLEAFGMDVGYYLRGEDLRVRAEGVDLVVNALNVNSSSRNLLSEEFFIGLGGAYFVSFARRWTYDLGGLVRAIEAGEVAGAAIDCDPEESGDVENEFYQTALACEKILVTPHVAFATDVAKARSGEIVVENIVAYLDGEMINVVEKK